MSSFMAERRVDWRVDWCARTFRMSPVAPTTSEYTPRSNAYALGTSLADHRYPDMGDMQVRKGCATAPPAPVAPRAAIMRSSARRTCMRSSTQRVRGHDLLEQQRSCQSVRIRRREVVTAQSR